MSAEQNDPRMRAFERIPPPDPNVPFPTVPPGALRQTSRLFIMPAIIVGVIAACLLIAGGMYALLKESGDPSSYLEQVVEGGGTRRWQAAYELSKVIAASDGA